MFWGTRASLVGIAAAVGVIGVEKLYNFEPPQPPRQERVMGYTVQYGTDDLPSCLLKNGTDHPWVTFSYRSGEECPNLLPDATHFPEGFAEDLDSIIQDSHNMQQQIERLKPIQPDYR